MSGHWTVERVELEDRKLRLRFGTGDRLLSCSEVLDLLREDTSFRRLFAATLAAAPFEAFRWETPAITSTTVENPFECVLVDDARLARERPDARAFAEHFDACDAGALVASFANLAGDAWLVAPCPNAPAAAYPHLAAFLRAAPVEQQESLWQAVAVEVRQRLEDAPLWLSTAGLGVAWLHVRLDLRPKYYVHAPYRTCR